MALKKLSTVLLLILVLITSCQQESDEIKLPSDKEAFNANSTAAVLIKDVARRDGSEDNIIDGASCFSVKLPVTVIVNNQELIITTENDFILIERILDESDSDLDELTIVFPITLIRSDYSEIIITNEDQLEDYIDSCVEDGLDDDIECIDFKYPIKLTLYNTNTLVSKVITIENDEQLYQFIESLNDDDLVSFKFPVTLLLANGEELIVNDVEELELAIEAAEDECDEDDDIDFDDDDVDTGSFETILTTGIWQIEYYFNETNKTGQYSTYRLSFNVDGTITIQNGGDTYIGDWSVYGDNGIIEIDLDFDEDDLLTELSDDWSVNAFTASQINLKDDLDEPDAKVLTFKKL